MKRNITKRNITPHKGGRTRQRLALLTPDDDAKLRAHLSKTNLSFSDWVSAMLKKNSTRRKSTVH